MWRQAVAMLVRPSWRNTLIARLRRVAIVRGRFLVRILEASSVNVVSRTWWSWFSIFQWPRIHPANSAPEATPMGRLVTKCKRWIDTYPLVKSLRQRTTWRAWQAPG